MLFLRRREWHSKIAAAKSRRSSRTRQTTSAVSGDAPRRTNWPTLAGLDNTAARNRRRFPQQKDHFAYRQSVVDFLKRLACTTNFATNFPCRTRRAQDQPPVAQTERSEIREPHVSIGAATRGFRLTQLGYSKCSTCVAPESDRAVPQRSRHAPNADSAGRRGNRWARCCSGHRF
jgi:hypothetical protein